MLDVNFFVKHLRKMKRSQEKKFIATHNGVNYGTVLYRDGIRIGWIPQDETMVREKYISFCLSSGEIAFTCPQCGMRAQSLYLTNNSFVCSTCTNKLIWEVYHE